MTSGSSVSSRFWVFRRKISGSFLGPTKLREKITVGMIQTLKQNEESEKILDSFGTIIVDECHHIPAKTFRETITRFNSYYLYGLTATPMRKNNDEDLIYVYIGNILSEITADLLDDEKPSTIRIDIRETGLQAPFDYRY
ncbi:MAG: DEAD/DEAH box helicase family protein [Balneolaceae bacterium]|nr:DEAD/DEAH box helicase family protein [Balneolaceae bacterium]